MSTIKVQYTWKPEEGADSLAIRITGTGKWLCVWLLRSKPGFSGGEGSQHSQTAEPSLHFPELVCHHYNEEVSNFLWGAGKMDQTAKCLLYTCAELSSDHQ